MNPVSVSERAAHTEAVRQRVRLLGHEVRRRPRDLASHAARLQAALDMEGGEPVQGVLADFAYAADPLYENESRLLRGAFERCVGRLAPHVIHGFDAQLTSQLPLGRVSALATRWSVLVTASMGGRKRTMRVSADDSRRLAAEFVGAIRQTEDRGELEQRFLAHCVAALDALAFLSARAVLRRGGYPIGHAWHDVADRLEEALQT